METALEISALRVEVAELKDLLVTALSSRFTTTTPAQAPIPGLKLSTTDLAEQIARGDRSGLKLLSKQHAADKKKDKLRRLKP